MSARLFVPPAPSYRVARLPLQLAALRLVVRFQRRLTLLLSGVLTRYILARQRFAVT
jgi:hypothetical protein